MTRFNQVQKEKKYVLGGVWKDGKVLSKCMAPSL